MLKGSVTFSFRLPYTVRQEGKWFYSCCAILDVFSQGHTRQEAADNLTEAVQLFIESCYERGVLDQVLQSSGFHSAGQEVLAGAGAEYLEVPISLIASARAENRAH